MLQKERTTQILSIIEEKKFVTIKELQKHLYVSLPTIRRDLAEMERYGLLLRHHGGASMMPKGQSNQPIFDDALKINRYTLMITQVISEIICDGSVIFVDSSLHEQAICNALLSHKNLIVVTNSPSMSQCLMELKGEVHCLGGRYIRNNRAIVGEIADNTIRQYNFDFALIAGAEVNNQGDISCSSLPYATILCAAMGQAQCKVVLSVSVDEGTYNIYNVAPASKADYIISNIPLSVSGSTTKLIHL